MANLKGKKVTDEGATMHDKFAYNEKLVEQEIILQMSKEAQKNNRIITRLKKRLKPKFMKAIKHSFDSHACHELEIVNLEQVSGYKVKAADWFGESMAIRHVYEDTSSDSYSDTYGGRLWLPIGRGQYLHMRISG